MFKYLYRTLADSAREMVDLIRGNIKPEEQPMKRGQAPKNKPPALVRIQTLGWRQPCGHHAYEWNAVRAHCEQCVREGRVIPKDQQQSQEN